MKDRFDDYFWREKIDERDLNDAALFLVNMGYPVDFGTDATLPRALKECLIDVYWWDADGDLHGNTLSRSEVEDFLADEGGWA